MTAWNGIMLHLYRGRPGVYPQLEKLLAAEGCILVNFLPKKQIANPVHYVKVL
jgi:hypothetical protein